jgi:hypothetical protein
MAILSPNTRHYVKLLRDVLVDGKGKFKGDVVEVDDATKRRLIAMRIAVAHTPIAEKLKDGVEKAAEKFKGK